jgi:hypothetical protein
MANIQKEAINFILGERTEQEMQWGTEPSLLEKMSNEFYLHKKLVVLGEEYGELCHAVLERDSINLFEEAIQVAAVALAILEGVVYMRMNGEPFGQRTFLDKTE